MYLEMSTKGLCDREIRKRILANFTTLVADLDADRMSDYFIEGLVITIVQWQEILNKKLTKQGRCRELLNLLLTTKNPKALGVFMTALERNSQGQWILELLSKKDLLDETDGNAPENVPQDSDRQLEEARMIWEIEKRELLEHQRQLKKQNEELLEAMDNFKELCEIDGNFDGLTTRAPVSETTSLVRFSRKGSQKSMGRSYVIGKVHLKLVYNPSLCALAVTVVDCKGLAPINKESKHHAPYVKLYVLPDDAKTTKRKTAVKHNTLNPVYGDTFSFPLTLNEDVTYTLWVSVWYKFKLRRNKLLGDVFIPLEDHFGLWEIDEWYYLEKK